MSQNQQFNFSVPIMSALLWRFNNAPALTSLITSKQQWYDANQTAFWNDWFTDVFNIPTANQFGCVVWAIILGIPLSVILDPTFSLKKAFGFGPFGANFFKSNFGTLGQTVQPLTVPQQRQLLQLRYAQLISRGTVTSINALLARIFGGMGGAYVIDNHDMTMTYVFGFTLPSALLFIFQNYDILPRPAGVSITITE